MFEIEKYKSAFDDIRAPGSTRTEVLKMAENIKRTRRGHGRRIAVLAAAMLIFILGAAAYAALEWNGFALTGGMSRAEVNALMDEASIGYADSFTDADGTVHYLDREGNETMALPAGEAAQYEREREAEREEAVRSGAALVDVDTLPVVPKSVTALAVGADGVIPELALGNGHMALFCAEGETGFPLEAGDRVALSLTSNDDCRVEYFVIRGGAMAAEAIDEARARTHSFSYEITEPGDYCIAILYASASASNFTEGTLRIEPAR